MAKFSKENKPAGERNGKDDDKKGGRSSYKAKRSFTRNKGFREKDKAAPSRGSDRDFKRGGRPFEKKDADRQSRDSYRSGDRGRRDDDAPRRPSGSNRDEKPTRRSSGGESKERNSSPYRSHNERGGRDEHKPRAKKEREEKPYRSHAERGSEVEVRSRSESRPTRERSNDKPYRPREERGSGERRTSSRPADRYREKHDEDKPRRVKHSDFEEGRSFEKQKSKEKSKPGQANKKGADDGLIRLNKYLANAGLASRREADTLIQSGAVKVNGVVVDQLGYKIKPGDKVTYGDESVKGEKKVYLLLNKPKDYITTVDDPRDRKTVMELIKGACRERVYPVGRLDRNTTGILLFTNDGELTTKLTHPKYGVKKVYHVTLDKNLKTTDFKALTEGIELEDGKAHADDLAFVGEGKREVGIEIHSGRNRIVRRMFEHLGYSVIKLDRVVFAGLTKKDLPRGKHRFLTAKEVSFLKMIG